MPTRSAEPVPTPHLEPARRLVDGPVTGVLLLAHGGKERSHKPVGPRNGPVRRMRWIDTAIGTRLAAQGVAVHVVRFRYQGWNDSAKDPVADVRWAVAQLAELYGDVPIVLAGHSLGGRAVVNAADSPGVVAVLGLAPWLPPSEPTAQLAGRRLLLAHGTQDKVTSPQSSFEYAARAQSDGYEVARIVLPGSGHTLLKRGRDWNRLVLAFTLSALVSPANPEPRSPEPRNPEPHYAELIADAFAAEGQGGLNRVLATDGRIHD